MILPFFFSVGVRQRLWMDRESPRMESVIALYGD
jgi:hypothetical protein